MSTRTVTASEFKAKCLKLMDEVNETGEIITVTKKGKPVAQLFPAPERRKSIVGLHKGRGAILGDIIGPFHEDWGEKP